MSNMHQLIVEGREYPAEVRIQQLHDAYKELSKDDERVVEVSDVKNVEFLLSLQTKFGVNVLRVSARDNEKSTTISYNLTKDIKIGGVLHKAGTRIQGHKRDVETAEDLYRATGKPHYNGVSSAIHALSVLSRNGWFTGQISLSYRSPK